MLKTLATPIITDAESTVNKAIARFYNL